MTLTERTLDLEVEVPAALLQLVPQLLVLQLEPVALHPQLLALRLLVLQLRLQLHLQLLAALLRYRVRGGKRGEEGERGKGKERDDERHLELVELLLSGLCGPPPLPRLGAPVAGGRIVSQASGST